MTRADLLAALGLAAVWGIPILVVGAAGEFPVADDWAYARTTRIFVETGRFERDAWVWIPILTHVGVGAGFVSLFGFSFEVLRWSTLALGLAGTLASYALCRTLGARAATSFVGAASVATSPLWVNLSFTFMTDVPFAALCALALVLLARGVAGGGRGAGVALAAGCLVALAAAGSRQIGLALLAAAALALLAARLRDPRAWGAGVGSLLLGLVLLWLAPRLFSEGDARTLFTLGDLLELVARPHAAYHVVRNSISCLVYLGVFLLPAALLALPAQRPWRVGGATAAGAGVVTLALAWSGLWWPPGIDVIHDFYMGPISLAGRDTLPRAPAALWWGVTFVGLTSGLFVLARLGLGFWSERESPRARPDRLVLLLFVALYLAPLLFVWPFFDRYLVPLLAPLVALVVSFPGRTARGAALAVLVALAAYGVVGTRDAMEHHRARWALLDELRAQGVASDRIDGGTEFGGLLHYDSDRERFRQRIGRYFVVDDEYLVTLGAPPAGYEEVAHRSYRRLLPPRSERVTLYRRLSGARAPASTPPS